MKFLSIKDREQLCFTHRSVNQHGQYLHQQLKAKKICSYAAFQSMRRASAFLAEQETQGNLNLGEIAPVLVPQQ